MATIDAITFNGERELFEIRYNVLKDYVDEFIVVEFDKTFSGKPKEPSFPYEYWPKVTYKVHREDVYGKYHELAESSPNTQGAEHWKLEFAQKESIKDALTHLQDDDMVFVGDCDEIHEPETVEKWGNFTGSPFKVGLKVYTYYLNNRSSETFHGTLVSKYRWVRTSCLNTMRVNAWKTVFESGWHFTSMGGYENVKKKLSDSYTRESYWTPEVEANLEENIKQNKDFLGRDFTYRVDESEWPQWLKDNRQRYKHMLI